MPYVNVVTNKAVSKKQERELVDILGPGIEVIPEKVRTNLFIRIEGDAGLHFGKNPFHEGVLETPCAMVTVDLFGKSENQGLADYSSVIRGALKDILEVEKENIYINYTECRHWGSGGNTNTAF